jgi:hypothetical protein
VYDLREVNFRRFEAAQNNVPGNSSILPNLSLYYVAGFRKIADVQAQVALSMFSDFENFTTFKPHEHDGKAVHLMADEVIAWGGARKALRRTP